ncbi:MAG: BolA/IbaG family iron-sulfur metabolism protein [Cocleimonas sp.]|nr:BolA/IbaG family iron-sulfur metabolism protein [Cocleimonas sp.]
MSISNEAVVELILTAMPDAKVEVTGDGYKYEATVISDSFDGLNTLKKHQMVYAAVDSAISSGDLHALTIIALTPNEVSN